MATRFGSTYENPPKKPKFPPKNSRHLKITTRNANVVNCHHVVVRRFHFGIFHARTMHTSTGENQPTPSTCHDEFALKKRRVHNSYVTAYWSRPYLLSLGLHNVRFRKSPPEITPGPGSTGPPIKRTTNIVSAEQTSLVERRLVAYLVNEPTIRYDRLFIEIYGQNTTPGRNWA